MAGRKPSILHGSTSTPLSAAGVYASAWQQVRRDPLTAGAGNPVVWDRSWLRGVAIADVASAADGFQVQFANADDYADSWVEFSGTLAAETPLSFGVRLNAKWARLVLTNGAAAQTELYLTARLEDD